MRAITLYQPHASLCAIGAKKIETRSWGAKYRGYVAIHSSQCLDWITLADTDPFKKYLWKGKSCNLPLGQILAITVLSDCLRIEEDFPFILSEDERAFGDFSLGRYAWFLDVPRILTPSISVRGRQGLWDWVPKGIISLGEKTAIWHPETVMGKEKNRG